ncbi:MAG TPA: uroporphyrinogen decarboxylase family protein [Anaerolineales bacterium]|nr:uroporphyrinogen decarboxylase family protein [Anaerolineales bacterium]
MREKILSLLSGQKTDMVPAFSGLIHVTIEGLEREGLSLHEVHHEAGKMARAAASTFKLAGMPSAALPLDLCAPAEALGAELNFDGDGFPQVKRAIFESTKEINAEFGEILHLGRLGIICKAIGLVKEDIGKDVVISGLIPGSYTLLLYLCNPANLFMEMKKEPQAVLDALFHLSSFLADIGKAYRDAGADFITIHDMGGSAGFIGPARYEQFVFPAEKDLIGRLPKPCVLSVCGKMNNSLHLLAQTGADAISVDQLTDIKAAREVLKNTLLFGNIDPVAELWRGDEAQVAEAVFGVKEAGADAVWPGCDLVPSTPIQNMRLMLR